MLDSVADEHNPCSDRRASAVPGTWFGDPCVRWGLRRLDEQNLPAGPADAAVAQRFYLLSELRAVVQAAQKTDDPRMRIVLSAARIYLEKELLSLQ
jgi:hypothetical protein